MAFHVHPDPQAAALQIAPGATTFTVIGQLTGASDPVGAYNKMMFIRVGMSGGASPPDLFLRAGVGTAVQAVPVTTAVFRGPGIADYVGDVQLVTAGEAANVFQIKMGFDQNSNENWEIGIKNNNAAACDFTWVVAESLAETAQPWIVVAPVDLPYHVLVNKTIDQSVTVFNKGTGTLNVTAVNPALPAGFTVTTALPLVVAPSASASLAITFTAPGTPPAPDGVTAATAVLTASPADTTASTSAGHNQQLQLTATTQELELVLLLDSSGSMSWSPLGAFLPAGDPAARWGELVSATNQFLDLLAHFAENHGRFGIARFPAANPANPSTYDIVPMTKIPDVAGMAAHQGAVAAVVPSGGTPMGDGLDRVLAPATSFFGTDALSVNADRRWLVLLSDGAHNSGTHNPLEFVAPLAPAGTSLLDKKISMFGVAYGIDGASDVDHALMTTLANGSLNGQRRDVDDEGVTPTMLAGVLRDAIKSGLTGATSPADPPGTFVIGGPEIEHGVVITRHDTRLAFVLNWNTPNANRLRLELLTPSCEVITPENAGRGRFRGVTFHGGDRSNMYLVDPRFVVAEPDVADEPQAARRPTRFGTWRFLITSPGGGDVDGGGLDVENYVYDVIVDSTLRMEVTQDRSTCYAGDPITLSARLTADGKPVTGASVSLSTTAPAQSFVNWFADLRVPPEALERARRRLDGQDASPLLVKQVGAQLAGLVFDGGRRSVTMPMTDPDGIGVYRATFTDTSVPEHHTFYVTATGVTSDGVDFRRDGKQETFVLVRPMPEFTQLNVHELKQGQKVVTIIPRDQFGNVLLVDPSTTAGFGLHVKNADLGALISQLDGTYTTIVTHDPRTNPAIGLEFDGVEVIKPEPGPVLEKLTYPDRVRDFALGHPQDTNEHDNPEAALGPVAGKPDDRFVSLGANGSITLGFGRRVVVATGRKDVTVFVQPDADLRSYRVEAFVAEHGKHGDWVSLGESIGVTKSFSLAAAELKSTPVIRVVDTSGRTRDHDLKPLSSPGVSIRGVGVLKTGKDLAFDGEVVPE